MLKRVPSTDLCFKPAGYEIMDGNFWVQDSKQGPRPQLLFLGIEGESESLCRR